MAYVVVTRYMPVFPRNRKSTGRKYKISSKKMAKIGRLAFNFTGKEILGIGQNELLLENLTVDLISAPKGSISGQQFEVTVIIASDDAVRLFHNDEGVVDKALLDKLADKLAMKLAHKLSGKSCFHVWVRALGYTGYYRFEDGRL